MLNARYDEVYTVDEVATLPEPPEEFGFGVWQEAAGDTDAVDCVNRVRGADTRTLREVVEDLSSWQA